jgi:hypothetical protein
MLASLETSAYRENQQDIQKSVEHRLLTGRGSGELG